jgi:voltage-gated sodium channel
VAKTCARIVASTWFDAIVFGVIVGNAVVLGLQTYDSIEAEAGALLDALNDLFLVVFVVELVIRMASYGRRPGDFFKSGWNVFDFVVVGAAFIPGLRQNSTLLRLVRLARVLRVIRILPDLRLLVTAVVRSLPGLASLTVMGVLLVYVYGMIGWLIFGDALPDEYGTIGEAMLTLFLLLSLENLPAMVEEGMQVSDWAVPYYVSFTLIAAFLLLNILIGVVVNSMEEARELEWQRERDDRLTAATATTDGADDRGLGLVDRVHELHRTTQALEHEIRAIERELRSAAGARRS